MVEAASLRSRGFLLSEMIGALMVLTIAMAIFTPLLIYQRALCRDAYYRAIAIEIIDGEMEVLMAGEWQAYGPGQHNYVTTAQAAQNLPEGKFMLTIDGGQICLEWLSAAPYRKFKVTRVAKLPGKH